STASGAERLKPLSEEIVIKTEAEEVEVTYPMGDAPLLWDEFNPNLYTMEVTLRGNDVEHHTRETFGMREFSTEGTQFMINGRPVFLRGTMEGAIFPKTGYPPTDEDEWTRIFKVC